MLNKGAGGIRPRNPHTEVRYEKNRFQVCVEDVWGYEH